MEYNMIEIAKLLIDNIEKSRSDEFTFGESMAQVMIEPLYGLFGARCIAEMITPKDYLNFTDDKARLLFRIEYMRKLDETELHISKMMSRPAEPQDLFYQ